MLDILSYLNSILDAYWGQSRYQLLLYLSIGIILLKEKESWKKITFGWYGIVCFIGLMNPITLKITSRIWEENVAYYCRQLSLIPVFLVIAYGIIIIIGERKSLRRSILVLFAMLTILLNGYSIYQETWYTKMESFEKIPKSIIEITEYLDTKNCITKIMGDTGIGAYIRQCNSDVIQIIGRYSNGNESIDNELKKEKPNAEWLMEEAIKSGCDYIVIMNKGDVKNEFNIIGQEPCFENEDYLIYEVANVQRNKIEYNEMHLIEERSCLDENNNLKINDAGYASVIYRYDEQGRCVSEKYLDASGKSINRNEGYGGIKYEYDDENRISTMTYLNTDGKPQKIDGGYTTIKYVYGNNDNEVIRLFYDEDMNPICNIYGVYGQMMFYNDDGQLIKVQYIGDDGKIVKCYDGYTGIKYYYNNDGEEIDREYLY